MRESHHLTQEVAAQRCGVAYRTWQSWEQGTSIPRWPNKEKLARLFNVTVDELNGAPALPPGQLSAEELRAEVRDAFRDVNVRLDALVEAVRSAVGSARLGGARLTTGRTSTASTIPSSPCLATCT